MMRYALRRFLGAIPTLFVIITLAFFMMRAAPGGPFDSERRLPPEVERNVKAAYNLDKPLAQQYLIYLGKLAHGDLGPSYKNKDFTVAQLIGTGLPVSARLGLTAMALALLVGSFLGIWAALRQNKWQDYSVMSVAMLGITIPTFVTAPLLTLVFGIYGITLFGHDLSLPVGGWNGGAWRNMILPVTVLALPQIAIVARMMRGSMVEVLRANYIRTARAKGLGERSVLFLHALKNAAVPIVTVIGIGIALLIGGAVVTESVFAIPGLGRLTIDAIVRRDYPLIQGLVLMFSFVYVLVNLAIDLVYTLLDPRIRY